MPYGNVNTKTFVRGYYRFVYQNKQHFGARIIMFSSIIELEMKCLKLEDMFYCTVKK